jgi:outer membrane receptor protein involved in Fe transport
VSRALVLRDGLPVNDPFGGWVYWRAMSPLGIERVEIVPSGASALFGNFALGGVLQLISRPIDGDRRRDRRARSDAARARHPGRSATGVGCPPGAAQRRLHTDRAAQRGRWMGRHLWPAGARLSTPRRHDACATRVHRVARAGTNTRRQCGLRRRLGAGASRALAIRCSGAAAVRSAARA